MARQLTEACGWERRPNTWFGIVTLFTAKFSSGGFARPPLTSIRDLTSAKFSWTRLGAIQSLWIHLASAAPPAKKVNHETAPERFFGRLQPKWRIEPSLPQTALERRTANPRKYAQK
jgi:hypothetical protein